MTVAARGGFDLVIGPASVRGRDGSWWIGLRGARIAAVSATPLDGDRMIDAAGGLVLESFVNAHMHLDKVHTLDRVGDAALLAYTGGQMGGALESIELASAVKDDYDSASVLANARASLFDAVRFGVRHVLAFADVDSRAGVRGVRVLLELRAEFAGVVDLQVVAFPQDGLVHAPGTYELMREAVELGADVVGGIPWIEPTDADALAHVRQLCELARDTGRRVAMLVDDAGDPALHTTEMLASELIRLGLQGRGVANHARALGLYAPPSVARLARLARSAGLGFVANPHTGSLHLPVFELAASGLAVALGQDDCEDAYYAFGRHNMLEVVFLAAHLLAATTGPRLDALLDAVTTTAAQVMGIADHRLAPGGSGDLVVLGERTVRHAVAGHEPPRFVIAGGRVVAESSGETRFSLRG